MGLFKSLIPEQYQLLARVMLYVALVVALVGYGYIKGNSQGTEKLTAFVQKQATEATRIAKVRTEVTDRVVTEYVTKIVPKTQETTRTIEKEVVRYVDRKIDVCPASVAAVELLNSAASNSIPESARVADDSASGVTTAAIVQSCSANYATYNEVADRLRGLQTWIKEQASVK